MRTFDVLADNLKFPEGPVFDPAGRLWFVELQNACVCRMEGNGKLTRFDTGGVPNGLAADADGHLYVADKTKKVLKLPAGSARFETLAFDLDGVELAEPNDIAFDPAGNLVFTCPGGSSGEPIGYVCRLGRNGTLARIAGGMQYPNGLAFNAAGDRLILAESATRRLLVSGYDPAGLLSPELFCQVGGGIGGPDGMALDASGHLWVALFGWGQLAVVDAEGAVIDRVGLPGAKPTNCAFDPSGRLGLVVTEAELGRVLSVKPAPPGLALRDGRAN